MLALAACTPSTPQVEPTELPTRAPFTPAPTGWLTLTPAPTARLEVAAAVADGGQVFVAGGLMEDGSTTDLVEIYDPGVNTWRTGPPLPEPVHHAMGVAFEDEFVVIGGFGASGASDKVWRLSGGSWTQMPPLSHARGAGGAAVAAGRIVVVGGQDGSRLVAQTEVFDGSGWRDGAPIPTPRDHLGVAAFEGSVYAVAGREQAIAKAVRALERYDVRRDRWVSLRPPRLARGGIGVGVLEQQLVVLGGEGNEADGADANGVFPQIEAYNIGGEEWTRLDVKMQTPRHGVGAVVLGDALYVAVGGPVRGGSVSDALEMLKLGQRLSLL